VDTMAAAITIPISVFELSISFEKLAITMLTADRSQVVQALFDALAPWNPNIDEMEVLTTGKPSEQGIKLRLPANKVTLFFGATGCKFTKDAAMWIEADEILRILDAALNTLARTSGVSFGKKIAILSLHLQLKTVSFKDILRPFIVPAILKLDPAQTEAMAVVSRWPKHRITLDGSAAIANGIFVQTEREFDAETTYDQMKDTILNDELELFKLLGVEEVEA
jgi:hypothetical protein